MKSFKFFLNEGGNVKVGPKGQETSAAPFPIQHDTRAVRRTDVHTALSKIHDAFHKEHGQHLFGADKVLCITRDINLKKKFSKYNFYNKKELRLIEIIIGTVNFL